LREREKDEGGKRKEVMSATVTIKAKCMKGRKRRNYAVLDDESCVNVGWAPLPVRGRLRLLVGERVPAALRAARPPASAESPDRPKK